MTAFLPPNLIALFAPRDRIEFKAPIGELPHEKDRSKNPYSGIASFVQEFDPHSETPAKVRTGSLRGFYLYFEGSSRNPC